MSTIAKLTGAEFDSMVQRGAFDTISPKKIELIRGELRLMNPAGPIHDDHIEFLTMTDANEGRYRSIEIHVPPTLLAPRCYSAAKLNIAELFDV